MNLIFDLDGTLIDSRNRLYQLFQRLVPESTLSFEEYWKLKRNKISNKDILIHRFCFKDNKIEQFISDWMQNIETDELLVLDEKFPKIDIVLERLKSHAFLHICTARQFRNPAIDQLERLNLLQYFDNVLVTEQHLTKVDWILDAISNLGSHDWLIGDTGIDIRAGQKLGIKTCAVLSGFLNEKSLRDYSPDLIINSAVDFYI